MVRYAVRFESVQKPGEFLYEAIGTGSTNDKQFAHLYTTWNLATKKASSYISHPQWYMNVAVVPVEVVWP